MAAADYRLLTEATGQRIAAALEALSGTGAAVAAARTNLDVYSKGETDTAIAQSTADVIRTGDVVDNLTSTATDKPLSAAQGKALNEAIAQSTADVIRTGDVVDNLTSTATDKPLSAAQGKALNEAIAQSKAIESVAVTVNSTYIGSSQISCLKNSFMVNLTGWINITTQVPKDNATIFSGLPYCSNLYSGANLKCFLLDDPGNVYQLRYENGNLETDYNTNNIPVGEYRFNMTYFL